MEHPDLLVDLAIALLAAFAGAVLAVRLGQSAILGYILGGVLIGPNTPGIVGDSVTVEELANLGVILLMFTIGVHVSLRELLRVGRVALVGGLAQVGLIIAVGAWVGQLLGWGALESVFLGSVIAISSGVVMTQVLEERGEMGAVHGQIALGWSAVQDFATIVLVVVLTALGEGEGNVLADVGWATGKAVLFLAVLLVAGSRVLPWVFEQVADLRHREVFVLTIAAVALGAAYASTFFGLSLALGAFAAGIVVSESDLSHQILGDIEPLRGVFVGLFFVSVGMFVDPGYVARHLPLAVAMLALIVVGKGALIALLTFFFRFSWRTAILTGVALSQAGEFSFLIARLGADLKVISSDAFTLMLTCSAASIVLTPGLVALADPASRWLERRLPLADRPSALALSSSEESRPRGHAVVCGYGRVGRIVVDALQRRGFPVVVIEEDRRAVRELRERGVAAVLGSADHPAVLARAHLERARVLVVAIPDAPVSRRVVDTVRRSHPRLDIVARTHSHAERAVLQRHGANETVIGELELALEVTRFTLHRFGVDTREVQAILQRLRRSTESPEEP